MKKTFASIFAILLLVGGATAMKQAPLQVITPEESIQASAKQIAGGMSGELAQVYFSGYGNFGECVKFLNFYQKIYNALSSVSFSGMDELIRVQLVDIVQKMIDAEKGCMDNI